MSVLAAVFILVAAAGIAFAQTQFNNAVDLEEKGCVELCRAVSRDVRSCSENRSDLDQRSAVSAAMKRMCGNASFIDADGLLMRYYYDGAFYDEYSRGDEIETALTGLSENGEAVTVFGSGDEYYTVSEKRTAIRDAEFCVISARNITAVYKTRENAFISAAVAASVVSVISAAAAGTVSFLSRRRMVDFCLAFENVGNGYLNVRIPEKGAAEMRVAAEKFNTAAASAERSFKKTEAIAEGRKEFVDRLAHEMKTPLTSILCVADLLRIRRTVPDEERIEQAGIIVSEANRMKKMSSKLLELATAGSAELEMRPTRVFELIEQCAEGMRPALTAKDITLEIREGSEDGIILCDGELFKSLVYNIVDNAAKASEAGQTVTLTSRINGDNIVISVTDKGIGMTKDVLNKITKPFYMADKERSRKEGGAGIGLSLCVEIAQRHGAKLFARSKPGKGTTVSVSVPLYKGAAD